MALSEITGRSDGVVLGQFAEHSVAYDLKTETLHYLSVTMHAVLSSVNNHAAPKALSRALAEQFDADENVVASDVEHALAVLSERGLVGRLDPFEPPSRQTGSTAANPKAALGRIHPILDEGVRFRSSTTDLLRQVDDRLGTAGSAGTATVHVDIEIAADADAEAGGPDEIVVSYGPEHRYPSRESFLDGVPTLLNPFAVASPTCLTLHAGGARSPDGEIVLVTGPSGSGKSTLTAALVRAGWDYLGDEVIGIRPGTLVAVGFPKHLALSQASRSVLGMSADGRRHTDPAELRGDVARLSGDVGPVGRVIIASYEKAADTTLDRLEPDDGFVGLLANALNLAHVGQPGFDALCQLAETVPTSRLHHGGALDAALLVAAVPQ